MTTELIADPAKTAPTRNLKPESWDVKSAKKKRLRYWIFFGLFTVNFIAAMICVASEAKPIAIALMVIVSMLWAVLSLYNCLWLARHVLNFRVITLVVLGLLGLYPLFLILVLMANDSKIQKRIAARQFSDVLAAKTDSELSGVARQSQNLNADQRIALKAEVANRGDSFESILSAQTSPEAIAETPAPPEVKATAPVQILWEIRSDDQEVKSYASQKEVEDAIMRDEIKPQWECRQLRVVPNATSKSQPKWKRVERSFAIYRPVRARMWKGAAIGAGIGVVLWIAQNAVGAFILAARFSSPKALGLGLGQMFWLLMAVNGFVSALPEKARKSIAPIFNGAFKLIIIIAILAAINGGSAILSGAFSAFGGIFFASLLGALVGGLPGMAIGTLVGLIRRPRLPMPPDAIKEDAARAISLGVLLPMVLLGIGSYLYIEFVFPWAQDALTHSLQ